MWLPSAASSLARDIDQLMWLIWLLVLLGIALVIAGMLIPLLSQGRFRLPERRWLESLFVLGPMLLLIGVFVRSETIDLQTSVDEMPVVEIEALQFQWRARHFDVGLAHDSIFDLDLINRVVLPADRPFSIRLRSGDVIHSFFIPEFRIKRDLIPGRPMTLNFPATRAGRYELACAELCGLGHYRMRAVVDVLEPGEYMDFLREGIPPLITSPDEVEE